MHDIRAQHSTLLYGDTLANEIDTTIERVNAWARYPKKGFNYV